MPDNGRMTAPPTAPSGADLYRRLLRHVWPYRAALFAGVVAMVVGGLSDAALVKLTGPLIDELFVHRNESLAILLPLAIVAVFVVSGLASFVSGYANQWVGQKVILDLRRQIAARVLKRLNRWLQIEEWRCVVEDTGFVRWHPQLGQ